MSYIPLLILLGSAWKQGFAIPLAANTSSENGQISLIDPEVVPQHDQAWNIGVESDPSDSHRKEISHVKAGFVHAIRKSRPNPCYFKRCYPGQKCVVDGITGRATCICKRHCKNVDKPLCGTDDAYYINRCEMHRASCLAGTKVYDARNKDCFYKKSMCDADDFDNFLNFLLEYLDNSASMERYQEDAETQDDVGEGEHSIEKRSLLGENKSRHHKKKKDLDEVDLAEEEFIVDDVELETDSVRFRGDADEEYRALLAAYEDDIEDAVDNTSTVDFITTTSVHVSSNDVDEGANDDVDNALDSNDADENEEKFVNSQSLNVDASLEEVDNNDLTPYDAMYDDIITSDARGDSVKNIFRLMDLDMDGMVENEEIYQVGIMKDLNSVLPPPCSLFHLHYYSDVNNDRLLDIHELLETYNITVVRLLEEEKIVYTAAVYGDDVTLQCSIQGEPRPIWRRHDYDLAEQGQDQFQVNGSILRFREIHPKWSGSYSCHARVRPEINQVFKVSVHAKPCVEVYPRTQHVLTGSDVTMTCKVAGIPSPNIHWHKDGENIDATNSRYILLENNTELHINSALPSDASGYTCVANNAAGMNEDIGALFVDKEAIDSSDSDISAYFVFHKNGVMIVGPRSCEVYRRIHSSETVPGLLRQNKLCKISTDGEPSCNWSAAVTVGTRFVYAVQPEEHRILVLDTRLQRVVEVIATDPMPVSLHYSPSTDQLFVHCWIDSSRDRSTLQVIYASSIPGVHLATQVQPLDGGKSVDVSIFNFYIPPNGLMNQNNKHGFIAHKNEQAVYRLDLLNLLYDDDVIDLRAYDCTPEHFTYRPIGGYLDVLCAKDEEKTPRTLTIEYASSRVIPTNDDDRFNQEFVSGNAHHMIRRFPNNQLIKFYNVTEYGGLVESIDLHTNFQLSDAAFLSKYSGLEASAVYISSQVIGDVMYLDSATGDVKIISNLSQPPPRSKFPWSSKNRLLVPSAWYDRHLATAGATQLDIIDITTNDVSCRLNDVIEATAITWTNGQK